MKAWSSSSRAEGRLAGSFVRQIFTKFLNSLENLLLIGGGSFRTIFNKTLAYGSFIYGGSPSAISIAKMPKDHISTFWLYFFSNFISSGAIQQIVPTLLTVPLFAFVNYVA